MARVKGAMMTRKRRNATLKLAKGYWGSKSKHFKMAKQIVMEIAREKIRFFYPKGLSWAAKEAVKL